MKPIGPCVICLDDLSASITTTILCGHSFHHRCIQHWFRRTNHCPICRTRVTTLFNPITGCDEAVSNRRPRDDNEDIHNVAASGNRRRGDTGHSAAQIQGDLRAVVRTATLDDASRAWDARMPATHSWLYVPLIAAAQGLPHPGQALLAGLPAYNAAVAALRGNLLVMALPVPLGAVYYDAQQQENVMDAELDVNPTGPVATVIQQAVDQRLAALADPCGLTRPETGTHASSFNLSGLSAIEARNFLWETIHQAIAAGHLTDLRAAVIAPRILALLNESIHSGARITRSWIRSMIFRSMT